MLTVDIHKKLPDFTLNVSFTLKERIMAILGRSGSGKTMTLKCISGLVTPDSGSIVLNGRCLYESERKINIRPQQRGCGFVFQNYALFPHMTCYENIAFGMEPSKRSDDIAKIQDLMVRLKIEHLARRYPGQMSGGQQQRVALARALVTAPDILLLDEPFSALDTITRDSLQQLLLEVEDYYPGHVLLVTHNVSEACRWSSRIAVYETGKVLQNGTKQDILHTPRNTAVAALTGVKNLWPGTVAACAGDQISIELPGSGLQLKARQPRFPLETGQAVMLGIRSEELNLLPRAEDQALPGKITRSIEDLSSYIVTFEPAGTEDRLKFEVTVRNSETPWPVGRTCWLSIPADHLMIMPH